MKKELPIEGNVLRTLGNGLIIRHSRPEDAEALAKFNQDIHGEDEWDGKGVAEWTLDLISGDGPNFTANDFTIVENTHTGEIVSSCCLISQTWAYEGIPFKVGRPELVGTKQEYRRQGLVRQQFEILHEWSKNRGELAQAITGIPFYYRQFGYEMTLSLDTGRYGYELHVPTLQEEEREPYTFRSATNEDISFLKTTYDRACTRYMITAVWDEDLWHYELIGKRKYNINRRDIFIIEDQNGSKVGFIGIPPIKWRKLSVLTLYELSPGFSWSEVSPSVIRFLWQKGEALAKEQGQEQKMFGFWLGPSHPAYTAMASKLPRESKPYSYYMRVPDLPALIKLITPVIEARLGDSPFAYFSGDIGLNFYKFGLKITIKKGRLTQVAHLYSLDPEKSKANFPSLVFLHLLFGHRSMDELDHAFTDCYAKDEDTKNLLDALFPKKASEVWPIS